MNIRGEGTEDEGKLHEDVLGAYFAAQGLTTPAIESLLARVDVEYRDGVTRYNAFVTGVLPGVNFGLAAGRNEGTPNRQADRRIIEVWAKPPQRAGTRRGGFARLVL